MSFTTHPNFLPTVLKADAATCLVTGLGLSLLAGPIGALTALPHGLVLAAGLALLPVAAFIAFVASRQPIPAPGVWLVIAGNAAWVVASVWLLVGGAVHPNGLGIALVAIQAAAVAVLAELELTGVRRLGEAMA